MPPVGAPAMTFSASTQRAASRARPSGEASRSRSKRSLAAAATAHSRAAELDSPAPKGTVESTTTSSPSTAQAVAAQRPEDARDVGAPAAGLLRGDVVEGDLDDAVLLGRRHPEDAVVASGHGGIRPLRQRDRQAQATVVVGVLADEVDPARRRPHARRGAAEGAREGVRDRLDDLVGGAVAHGATSRRRAAAFSGATSLTQPPTPDSDPARNFRRPGPRSTDMSCRCSRETSRPVLAGACCQAAM